MAPSFCDWIAGKLGTRRWFVGRWSARTRAKYDVALSQQKYAKIRAEYAAAFGVAGG